MSSRDGSGRESCGRMFFALNRCDDTGTDMIELRSKKRAKRVAAIQKEGVDQDAAIGVEPRNKSRCRRGSRWGNAGERASIGLESAPVPFGTVVPAARSNPHDPCYKAV